MPLFKCSKCGCVENTALAGAWTQWHIDKKPVLCSECKTGKWHGEFPKDQADGIFTDRHGKQYTFVEDKAYEGCPGMIIEKYIKEKK